MHRVIKVGSTGSQPPGQGCETSRWSWLHLAEGSVLGRGGISSQPLMQLGNETFDQKGNSRTPATSIIPENCPYLLPRRANTSLKFFSNSASSLNPIRPKSLNWKKIIKWSQNNDLYYQFHWIPSKLRTIIRLFIFIIPVMWTRLC